MTEPARPALEEGDVVELRSGGAKMTVHHVDQWNAVCTWMDASGALQQAGFKITVLRKVPQ